MRSVTEERGPIRKISERVDRGLTHPVARWWDVLDCGHEIPTVLFKHEKRRCYYCRDEAKARKPVDGVPEEGACL